jgi:hypothetical protein
MERKKLIVIDDSVRRFLSEIGRMGGSKRVLTTEEANMMNDAKKLKRIRQRKVTARP